MISALRRRVDLRCVRRRLGVLSAGLIIANAMTAVMSGFLAPAYAEPDSSGSLPDPYPELRYFTKIDAVPYAQSDPPGASLPDQPGYWFVTAQGLNCGIWFRGSFGCAGDIPGAPPGVHQIGWITGDTRAHYDWTLAIRFPQPRGSLPLPPLTFIEVEGTTCATTVDNSTYCERGPFRFLITSTRTWLNG